MLQNRKLRHKISVSLSNGLDQFDSHLVSQMANKRVVLFLDYDGTLTPIVSDPTAALLSLTRREQLKELSQVFITGVISGRSLAKIQAFVDIDGLFYAGSHGFDILGPNDTSIRYQVAENFLPMLAKIREKLGQELKTIAGANVEDNVYALSVHYRNVDPARIAEINIIVDKILADYPDIRRGFGKMVFELKPNIEWNKGKALLWLLKSLELDKPDDEVFTIYIGDDTTDEDVFELFSNGLSSSPPGVGVLVTEFSAETNASLTLRNPDEVGTFLEKLLAYGKAARLTT